MWKWLGLTAVFGLASLGFSMHSYGRSLNRQEVIIAKAGTKRIIPAELVKNPFSLKDWIKKDKIRVYLNGNKSDKLFLFRFEYKGKVYENKVKIAGSTDTTFEVNKGEEVKITFLSPSGNKLYGWTNDKDKAAGECRENSSELIEKIKERESLISFQCWNDDGSGDDYFDDYYVIMTQPGDSEPVKIDEDEDKDKDKDKKEEEKGKEGPEFKVILFNDLNQNGVKEESEKELKQEWLFKVQIEGNPYIDYTVEDTGEGRAVEVDKGARVTVEATEKPGWILTSDKVQIKTLTEDRLYKFYFGASKGFPAKQPETGAPAGLTIGAVLLGASCLWTRKRLLN